jgi:hypothetical protein
VNSHCAAASATWQDPVSLKAKKSSEGNSWEEVKSELDV